MACIDHTSERGRPRNGKLSLILRVSLVTLSDFDIRARNSTSRRPFDVELAVVDQFLPCSGCPSPARQAETAFKTLIDGKPGELGQPRWARISIVMMAICALKSDRATTDCIIQTSTSDISTRQQHCFDRA